MSDAIRCAASLPLICGGVPFGVSFCKETWFGSLLVSFLGEAELVSLFCQFRGQGGRSSLYRGMVWLERLFCLLSGVIVSRGWLFGGEKGPSLERSIIPVGDGLEWRSVVTLSAALWRPWAPTSAARRS